MKYSILLVDDNKHLRESVKLYLQNNGFEVTLACSVTQATQHLAKQIPDLIIVDIIMPQKDGYHLINYVRSNSCFGQVPIIVLTAKGMTTDRIRGYNLGCNAYLTKPFDPNELVSIIGSLILNHTNRTRLTKEKSSVDLAYNDFLLMKESFTPREISVLRLVILGLTNKEISKSLHTSKRNVEKYVSRLLLKTQTRNRTELAQYILRSDVFSLS